MYGSEDSATLCAGATATSAVVGQTRRNDVRMAAIRKIVTKLPHRRYLLLLCHSKYALYVIATLLLHRRFTAKYCTSPNFVLIGQDRDCFVKQANHWSRTASNSC